MTTISTKTRSGMTGTISSKTNSSMGGDVAGPQP